MKSKGAKGTALDVALKLLGQKDYSAPELRVKLASRGFAEEEIGEVLRLLQRYEYVVETGRNVAQLERMSAEWLRKRSGRMTPGVLRGLEAYLLKKGFDEDLVAEHLAKLAREVGES